MIHPVFRGVVDVFRSDGACPIGEGGKTASDGQSRQMTPTAAAGEGKELYYLVAPSLHEGVIKTEKKRGRGWASRRRKDGSFCESKHAKMACKTPHFDFRNEISCYFCKIISGQKSIFKNFITQSFQLKFAHPCAPARPTKRRRELLQKNPRDSSAWIYFSEDLSYFRGEKKWLLWPSLRSFFSLWPVPSAAAAASLLFLLSLGRGERSQRTSQTTKKFEVKSKFSRIVSFRENVFFSLEYRLSICFALLGDT